MHAIVVKYVYKFVQIMLDKIGNLVYTMCVLCEMPYILEEP